MLAVSDAMKADLLGDAPQTYVELSAWKSEYEQTPSTNGRALEVTTKQVDMITATSDGTSLTLNGAATNGSCELTFELKALSGVTASQTQASFEFTGENISFAVEIRNASNKPIVRFDPHSTTESSLFFNAQDYSRSIWTVALLIPNAATFNNVTFGFFCKAQLAPSQNILHTNLTALPTLTPASYRSVEYSIGTSTGGFTIGEFMSGKLTVECLTSFATQYLPDDYDFDHPTVLQMELVLGLERVSIGKFYISRDDSELGENYSTLVAYDRASYPAFETEVFYSDNRFTISAYPSVKAETVINMRSTIGEVIIYLRSCAGVSMVTSNLVQLGDDAQQHDIFTLELIQPANVADYPLRSAISVIAANNYANAVYDPDSSIVFKKINEGGTVAIDASNYKLGGFYGGEMSYKTISGIRMFYRPNESSPEYALFDSSNGGPAVVVPQEMCWRFTNDACANAFYLNGAVYDDVLPRTLSSGSLECFGLPFVEVYDTINITDIYGDTYTLQPCQVTHVYNGGWTSRFSADNRGDEFAEGIIGISSYVATEPSASHMLMDGTSLGWYFQRYANGFVHAWRKELISLSGYAVGANVGPRYPFPFRLSEYVITPSATLWPVSQVYDITANATDESFIMGIRLASSSTSSMHMSLVLDGIYTGDLRRRAFADSSLWGGNSNIANSSATGVSYSTVNPINSSGTRIVTREIVPISGETFYIKTNSGFQAFVTFFDENGYMGSSSGVAWNGSWTDVSKGDAPSVPSGAIGVGIAIRRTSGSLAPTNIADTGLEIVDLGIGDELSSGIDTRFPTYIGPTTVTPSLADQVLETQNTSVLGDITVLEIPRADASNEAGGTTVTIGGQ